MQEGVINPENLVDVLYGWSLTENAIISNWSNLKDAFSDAR